MTQPASDTAPTEDAAPEGPRSRHARAGGRRVSAVEWTAIFVIGALLVGAIGAGFASLYRIAWGPEAFAERYVQLLADGRAADALRLPGVGVDSTTLADAGILSPVSDALLRQSALDTDISDIRAVASSMTNGIAEVTIAYRTENVDARSTFRLQQDGWEGLVPAWRFASSPLGVLDVSVRGSMRFTVNNFELDKRQISPDGANADPLAPVAMLVFVPGSYAVSVDTAASEAAPVPVLADQPLTSVGTTIQAMPTAQLRQIVTEQVHAFLDTCATQRVLLPTGCPFGVEINDRIIDPPTWSIAEQPDLVMEPSGAYWTISPAEATAHIDMTVQTIYDGSIIEVSADVPFRMDGTVTLQPDGSAAIEVGSPDIDSLTPHD